VDEERGPVECPVTGTIPTWAAGSLYRTGPGQSKVEDTVKGTFQLSHWFDGLAHTHRFDIEPAEDLDFESQAPPAESTSSKSRSPTRVLYSSRKQSEALAHHIRSNGNLAKGFSFGQKADPCVGLLGKFMSSFQSTMKMGSRHFQEELSNQCVVVHPNMPGLKEAPTRPTASGGHLSNSLHNVWIATDTSTMRRIDPETLEPLGIAHQKVLHPDLKGATSPSHGHRDPETGDFFNVNAEFGRSATYRVFRVSAATGKTDVLATISGPHIKPAYIHSFFMSENHVVLCLPSSHLALKGSAVLWNRNIADSIIPFDKSQLCRWFVVDRRHGRGLVGEFESEAGFFFHSVNTFEEKSEDGTGVTDVLCDVVEYPNYDIIKALYYDVLSNRNGAAEKLLPDRDSALSLSVRLARYRLRVPAHPKDHGGSTAKAERLWTISGPHVGDLPTINPSYSCKPYRYMYSMAARGFCFAGGDTVVKTDLQTRQAVFWNNPTGHTPGEAIFIARPGAVDEDDGVLLTVVLDGNGAKSYLLCLDAKTMVEMGRADMPVSMPLGFHGVHIPGGAAGTHQFNTKL